MTNTLFRKLALAAVVASLGACAVVPSGPSMLVLPGTGKPFDLFRADDASCRQYSSDQIGGSSAQQAANNSAVASAAVGTAVGAVAGAAIGGSQGAGVGAGAGLVLGSAAGTGAAATSGYGMQQRYDNAYLQCMYAKGHRVPVSGRFTGAPAAIAAPAAQPSLPPGVPPPPAGNPPPPPPGVKGG